MGVTDRTMRRWRERLDRDGYSGLWDYASHHFSFPAVVFRITSCAFIIRSISAAGICC
jgi:hypothetical protein